MNYLLWAYVGSVLVLALGLPVFSYITLIYRELGRMTTGRFHEHLEIFEAEIEPKLKINRRSGGRTFRILGHFWLAFVVLETTRGLLPLLPLIRAAMLLVWPIRVFLEGAESVARISEGEIERTEEQRTEEGIEALVEAAEEEGIIESDQADLIEQVVEFSDKRVREVMTPRPDIVAMQADASLEEMHARFVETRISKMPVYEKTLDDIIGIVYAQDLLQVADTDLNKRKVRELVHPALFVPETKIGSDLLKEMRQKSQTLAVVIDEHGSVAGIATIEDLVEEIVGESGADENQPAGGAVREADGSVLLLGNMTIEEVEEVLGIHFGDSAGETVTTLAGLISHVSGKVPAPGDRVEIEGYRFEILDANQRKVLRVRARPLSAAAAPSGH